LPRRCARAARRAGPEHAVPLFLGAARFAENAWLVTQHEAAYRDMSPRQVAEQAFRMADGCLMSAKRDGIVHIGGFLGLRDRSLAERCASGCSSQRKAFPPTAVWPAGTWTRSPRA
jgi:tryptophanase